MSGRAHTSGRVVTLACLVLAAGASARAAVLRESIEWAVADSDVVIRGRLAGVTREGPADAIGWATVDIEVLETIKGPPAGRVSVQCSLPDGRFDIDGWERSGGGERIVFLVNSRRRTRDREEYARHPLALREDGWTLAPPATRPAVAAAAAAGPTPTRRGAPGAGPAGPRVPIPAANPALSYDVEFRPLRDAAAVLAAARKAVREEPPPGPDGRAAVLVEAPPGAEALRDFPNNDRFVLKVPLDPRIERVAQAWALHPDSRHAALAVLTRLKSDRNAALLKTYLEDPSYVGGTTVGKAATWHHDDRLTAYEALRRWGVNVPKPDVEMPGDAYRPAGRAAAWGAAASVLLTATTAFALFVLRRRRAARRRRGGSPVPAPGFAPSLFDAAAVLLLLLAIAAAVLWRRSWKTVDEVTFATATGRHWVSAYRGRLQWVRVAGWERHVAPAYARFDLDASPAEPWTHEGVQVKSTGYHRGFSRLHGTVTYRGRTFGTPMAYAAREAPAWVPAALLAVLPLARGAFLLAGTTRRRLRRARHLCPDCGYDLRATQGRCPECGGSVTVPQPVATPAAAAERVAT